MANQVKLISKEELEKLQNLVKTSNQIQLQIGGIEAHKSDLLNELKKQTVDLTAFQKELENTYGAVNIDLQTGQITKSDEKPADNKKD